MTTYTHKPLPVDAIRYTAPDATGELGNVDEVQAFAGRDVLKQDPWAPEVGQNCIRVPVLSETSTDFLVDGQRLDLMSSGDYLVKDGDALTVVRGSAFEALYDASADSGGAHADGGVVEGVSPTADIPPATA